MKDELDRIAKGQERLTEGQERLTEQVDGLAEGQERLTEGQRRIDRQLDRAATSIADLADVAKASLEQGRRSSERLDFFGEMVVRGFTDAAAGEKRLEKRVDRLEQRVTDLERR